MAQSCGTHLSYVCVWWGMEGSMISYLVQIPSLWTSVQELDPISSWTWALGPNPVDL